MTTFFISSCFLPLVAHAAATSGRYGLMDPLSGQNIPAIIGGVIRFALGAVGALFLVMFIYGGILWMTAGSSDRIKTARKTLVYAAFGIVVVVLSYTILSVLISLTGQVAGKI